MATFAVSISTSILHDDQSGGERHRLVDRVARPAPDPARRMRNRLGDSARREAAAHYPPMNVGTAYSREGTRAAKVGKRVRRTQGIIKKQT